MRLHGNVWVILTLALFIGAWARADVIEPSKAVDLSPAGKATEELRRRAVDAFNAQNYPEAEKLFYQVLEKDSVSPVADNAMEYLQRIAVGSGAVDYAIKHYRELKSLNLVTEDPAAIASRVANLNALKAAGKIKGQLASVFKIGGVLAARATLFGFIINNMGLPAEASYFLDRAEGIVQEVQREAYQAMRAYLIERPLHYAFSPSIYGRSDISKYSPGQFQIIPFEMQQKRVSDVTMVGSLDGWRPHVTFSYAPVYDSNVVNSYPTTTSLGAVSRKDGVENELLLNFGAQGNVMNALSYGFDYTYFNRSHPRGDLEVFDFDTHVASFWVSSWNRMNNEIRLRLDAGFTGHHPQLLGPFSSSFGPQISVAHHFDSYRIDLSYEYKFNHDGDDPELGSPNRRGGHEHVISALLTYPGKNTGLQPFAGYLLDRDLADGWNFSTITHQFKGGTYYLIGERSSVEISALYDFIIYPTYGTPRADALKTVRFAMNLPALQDLLVFIFGAEYQIQTSDVDLYNFNRWQAGFTTVIHLDI